MEIHADDRRQFGGGGLVVGEVGEAFRLGVAQGALGGDEFGETALGMLWSGIC